MSQKASEPKSTAELTSLQRAALTIKELKSKLEASRQVQPEPVAVVGMACRFPGAPDLDRFWELLKNGVDAVTEVPRERWDLEQWFDPNPNAPGKINTRYGGFIEGVEYFDAAFFSIPPREANRMDPGQRILLELVWKALEHAYIPPDSLRGSNTGFFVGMGQNDYGNMQINGDPEEISAYSGTGNGGCFASGRISYQFGFNGPTLTTDTACSSSMVALYQALNAIHRGECDLALASGVQLNLTPPMQVFFSRTQSFSPDGRCFTFDERANGFVLGEGAGVVVLQRLRDAVRDGRRILGVIRSASVNHGGASGGLTVPNERAQEELIRYTLKRGKIEPDTIDFVETHGTGTNLGDPIEVGALRSVFGQRSDEHPLWLGSVKTNIGHLNAASGMAGLIKTILMLYHGKIVPNLHFSKPSSRITWDEFHGKIPTEQMQWSTRPGKPRRAGVSSFGLSGTNAHVILEEAPASGVEPIDTTQALQDYLLTLSAHSPDALTRLAANHLELLNGRSDEDILPDYCYSANTGRAHLEYRAVVLCASMQELKDGLKAVAKGEEHTAVLRGHARRGAALNINKVMDGDPVTQLLASLPNQTFRREELKRLGDESGISLSKILNTLASLYTRGLRVDWKAFDNVGSRKFVTLPNYPFARDRFWLDEDKTVSERQSAAEVSLKAQSSSNGNETASISQIMDMQLRLATETLKNVTDQQFAFLRQKSGSAGKVDRETADDPMNGVRKTPSGTAPQTIGQSSGSGSQQTAAQIDTKTGHTMGTLTGQTVDNVSCGNWKLLLFEGENNQDFDTSREDVAGNLERNPGAVLEASRNILSKSSPGGKRLMLTYQSPEDAIQVLGDKQSKRVISAAGLSDDPAVIFMFPGVGDHYLNVGRGLYQNEPLFRTIVDDCCDYIRPILGEDLLEVIYPVSDEAEKNGMVDGQVKPKFDLKAMLGRGGAPPDPRQERMNKTRFSQPLLFIIEYALGLLWRQRGVRPAAMIGYSIGEYTAAVMSGVMRPEEALMLVTKRAQLIETIEPGAMLAVPLGEEEAGELLGDDLFVAISSTPNQSVIAGPVSAIETLEEALIGREIMCRRLQSSHAFHTPMLKSLHRPLFDLISGFDLSAPDIPFVSNLTGDWITASEAQDPEYWANHTWQKVRFAEGMGRLLGPELQGRDEGRIFLEVGPGVSLGSFMLQHPEAVKLKKKMNLPTLRTMYERTPDEQFLLNTVGKLWLAGYSFSTNKTDE